MDFIVFKAEKVFLVLRRRNYCTAIREIEKNWLTSRRVERADLVYRPIIPATGTLRQEDHKVKSCVGEFKVSIGELN